MQRKLHRWAENPHQINSQILIKFLKLKKQYGGIVKESVFKNAFERTDVFNRNFPQMISISKKTTEKFLRKMEIILQFGSQSKSMLMSLKEKFLVIVFKVMVK